jgi:hypothetical protein
VANAASGTVLTGILGGIQQLPAAPKTDEEFYFKMFSASSNSLLSMYQGIGIIWNDDY